LEGEKLGVPTDKLNLVVVWREAPQFSPRERAALAWTEALTLLSEGVSDEVYAEASAEFSEKELAYLTSAVASINVWNRFGAALRGRCDLVVPRDALRLVVTNATADQVDLVGKIIVQHTVRKLRLLCDLAQAGPRIAELSQGFQRSLGKFDSSCTEFIDTRSLDSIRRFV